ncbi:nuclear pore complex protein NUP1-like [Neltuma alba]|uniref:nuclear pore complex protein NUP1-like n=1 Tax=Neltuma alba TaxID=207710 RepID=UPI0010A4CF08|nr:nuclear pore complex protein NUP1-like [Prosopis alba]
MFGSSLGASSSPIFSFSSSATTTSTQPVFGNPSPGFSFGSAANNDQMSMEDSRAKDPVQSPSPLTPATPAFVQQPAPPQPKFVFGTPSSSGVGPFQLGTQQNIPPQNPSPFQASGSLEFNGAGSFSLRTGGGDNASSASTPMFGSLTSVASSSTPMFGSSLGASSSPIFSFSSSATTTSTQPVFGNPGPGFSFGSAANNDQMSMEEDPVQSSSPLTPVTPAFFQQLAPPQPKFVFGAPSSSGTNPFRFGTQQNIPPQNASPFQASGSVEFNGAGSFSLRTGGGDKSGRKFVKVSKNRTRKK